MKMNSREEEIFSEVVALPVGQRASYLEQVCGDDSAQRDRINRLLEAHDGDIGILDFEDTQGRAVSSFDIEEGQCIGAYRLLQKIGEGGFGIVFMARQQQPIERTVAIKIIKPGMDSRAVVARFESERQALAMMDHPNIARVFDGGTSEIGERPYFVMELVQGVPITEFCDVNCLTTQERLELFISVCNAVHHAHQKGIIHRDIKPTNVMVTLHDGKPVAKVIDFGVAKAIHQRLTDKTLFTRYGMMVGTPQYMSPEQAEMTGLDVDTRSDVYSLSVLLYELMTGATPLEAEQLRNAGLKEIQRMICEDEALKPSLRLSSSGKQLTVLAKHRSVAPGRLSQEVRGDLDWIIMKGLEKERTRRYDSASSLAADVRRVLDRQPVLAGPPSLTYRARKFVSRNRVGVALTIAAITVLSAIAFGWFNHQKHRIAAVQKSEERLNTRIEEANQAMVTAMNSPGSNELWETADLMVHRVRQLADEFSVGNSTTSHAEQFLERYQIAREDRDFGFSMEELLINHSTEQSLRSLQKMEAEFRKILRNRGYDVAELPASELGAKMSKDRTPIKMTDALELWLAVRKRLSEAGGDELSNEEVERWIRAMGIADPHPMRTAIRSAIFGVDAPQAQQLDEAVSKGDLTTACARKLSWLAEAYDRAGRPDRSSEIRELALSQHPDDLMLNYEYAVYLMQSQNNEHAIRYLMRCSGIRPELPGVWRTLAEAHRNSKEMSQAKEAIKKAVELDSSDDKSLLLFSQLLLEDENPAAALALAEKALSLNENAVDAWRVKGRAHMVMSDSLRALVAFQMFQKRASESEAESVEAWIVECRQRLSSKNNR